MDHVPKEVRSKIMAAIHSRGNTTTELPLARLLWNAGVRGYRKHWPVAGKPDFAWPGRKVAVFVDGCFWHGCAKHGTIPKSNRAYWRRKLARNKKRDQIVARTLRNAGWRVIRIWYCVLQSRPQTCVERILRVLGG